MRRTLLAVTTTPASRAIRTAAELTEFLAVATPYAAHAAAMQQTDFSREMLLVGVGDSLPPHFRPWKARISGVVVEGGRVKVGVNAYWGPIMTVGAPAPTGPQYVAGFHAVRVARGAEPVDFTKTSIETQLPWE